MTSGTVACQASLSMGFPRPEYWSGLPFPSPGLPSIMLGQKTSRVYNAKNKSILVPWLRSRAEGTAVQRGETTYLKSQVGIGAVCK